MELRHLRYFISVAEQKSIRQASEKIFVTQPAISRQIKDLESELGFELFIRLPRGLELTAAGAQFYRDTKRILGNLDYATKTAARVAAGLEGHLRLGFVENAGWDGPMPRALREFERDVPGASIELVAMNTPQQLQQIENGILDGGFIYAYESLQLRGKLLPLAEYDVTLAVPASWDIDSASVSLRDMASRPFVMFPREVYPAYYDCLLAACQNLGVTLRIVQEELTESAMLALVCSGVGAAIINSANRSRPPALARFLDMTDFSIPMPLCFAYRAVDNNPILARFLDNLRRMAHITDSASS